jgi:hypothetical protein
MRSHTFYLMVASFFTICVSLSTRSAPNCWCKFGTEGGHQHHSTLLLRRGKELKSPFGGLHLLQLLLTLLLLQLLSKN